MVQGPVARRWSIAVASCPDSLSRHSPHSTPAQHRSPWLTAATPLAHPRPPTTAGLQDSNPVLADVFNAVEALFSAPTPVNDPSAPEVASNPVFADVANAVEALFSAPTPVNDPSAPEVAVVGGFGKSMANAAFGVEALASATTAGRATRNAPVAQSPLGHSLADAFFGTFKGNDYPDLGFPTGFSG